MLNTIKTAKTKENNTITFLETTNRNPEKSVLIIGVFHGEEPQGEYLINEYLKTDLSDIKNKLYFVPCLNPDGKSKNQRQNANGIDLNRNFPTKNWRITSRKEYFGGNKPASEIETKFMIDILENYKFDAILSIHAPFEIVNYDGNAKDFAEKISQLTGYPVQSDIGYPTPGSFGNYCGVERNIPIITLELPEDKTNEELWETNKAVFEYFANEF